MSLLHPSTRDWPLTKRPNGPFSFVFPIVLSLSLTLSATAQETPDAMDNIQSDQGAAPAMKDIEEAWQRGDFAKVREGLSKRVLIDTSALTQFRYARVLIEGRGGPVDASGAIAWLERASAQDYPPALTLLARVWLSAPSFGLARDAENAVALLHRSAALGDAEGQYYLGLLALNGEGMARDPAAAVAWLLAAAEQETVEAQYLLSTLYEQGTGTPADSAKALRWLTSAAENGHTVAQYRLAQTYEDGKTVARNTTEAMRWYRRAADGGLAVALRDLGAKYMMGEDIEKDAVEGMRLLTAAAQAGEPGAMYNLGVLYSVGEAVTRDDVRAADWFTKAAERGSARAKTSLASMIEVGRGAAPDQDRAIALYLEAANEGDELAKLQLARLAAAGLLEGKIAPQRLALYFADIAVKGDANALVWLEQRSDQGLAYAQSILGWALLQTDAKWEKGITLLTQAAEAGDLDAQSRLGQAYVTGDFGLEQDYITAHKWLNIAATGGDREAERTRAIIGDLMTPEQLAKAHSLARAYYAAEDQRVPKTEQMVINP